MKNIQEVLTSSYKGSSANYEAVKHQIKERFGDECASSYNPWANDCMTLVSWANYGFRVKVGSKALKSTTFVEIRNERDEVIRKIKRTVNLFHKNQVEKIA